jgi:hypothetical protein
MFFDFFRGGAYPARTDRHRLAGTVPVTDPQTSRLIAVLSRKTFAGIAFTATNRTTGAWQIKGLEEYPENTLIVMAIDVSGTENAMVFDSISQVTGA